MTTMTDTSIATTSLAAVSRCSSQIEAQPTGMIHLSLGIHSQGGPPANAAEADRRVLLPMIPRPWGPGREQLLAEITPVAMVQASLGDDAICVPIPTRSKIPSTRNWENTPREMMSDPAYLARLNQGNIGVLLGKKSGGICVINIDDDRAEEPFLALNPRLSYRVRTHGVRGCAIWVRLKDENCPPSKTLLNYRSQYWGQWLADGAQCIFSGRHPTGACYELRGLYTVAEMFYADIVWPR